jgi:hypothetical protein
MKAQVDAAIKADKLRPTEGMRLLAEYERGLRDQTYLTLPRDERRDIDTGRTSFPPAAK